MDILKQEIERKKRQLEERKLLQPAKKYFKRSDLVKLEEQEYYEKYGKASENSGVVENSKSQLPKGDDVDDEIGEISLPKKEVIKRLRDRGEPIMLFGETEFDTFKRLRKCEILEPESVKGLRNDFQEAMEKVDQAYLDELIQSQGGGGGSGESSFGSGNDNEDGQNRLKQKEKLMSYEEIQVNIIVYGLTEQTQLHADF
ncbi:unnamed protein product [Nesidiocoris tenuis]|uniref:Pre-mRNA processing factor 4 (PRP4)-like domain-containing protein n=1 Tax=Nesidiocoris tenuis TaxID=355587 RepID=A0A6H5GUC0_9HEMI|nr:unnamed protein product [Nesidiocoris tenuis]